MPPKRTESSVSKRKAISDSDDDTQTGSRSASGSQNKKAKTTPAESSEFAPNGQPTNKVLPVKINFPGKTVGTWRISSWNVSGLAAAQKKGFKNYVEAEDADILILTETKVNNEPADPTLSAQYPHRYWSISDKKGYSGTAVLSKHEPLSITRILPGHSDPASVKGRILTLEFEKFYLVATYVVNAGQDLKTLSAKEEWNRHFTRYIRDLDSRRPVIWTGDLNVAPTEIDLTNAKKNWNKTPGYTESETTAFAQILSGASTSTSADAATPGKFIDVWRRMHPDTRHYTYFSYRFNCRMKGIGWRLDMFVLSERILEHIKMCEIRSEIYGASDHCPIVLEIAADEIA